MSDPGMDSLEGIAIVGMAGRFPGARRLDQFWRNLRQGVESAAALSDEDLASAGVPPDLAAAPNYVRRSPGLDEIDRFDAEFFGINPGEAEILDPQHRHILECAWEALEDAGYDPHRYPGWIAVYAGVAQSGYLLSNLRAAAASHDPLRALQHQLATDKDHLATRVSYKLNLRGPSMTVQTACSSSLVAIDLARQSLLAYGCDMALAGGVSVAVPQRAGYLHQEGGILSPDGHCRAFDARAAGTLFGSGVGIVVLKRLRDALADGDRVHAVIRGSAVNNDGAVKVGYTAPGVEGQATVIAMAQGVGGVHPDTIGYVEAHGTGTPLGDQIEIEALTQAFRAGTSRRGFCAIGSVKTNIGHLETAAGIAGLIKAVLALEHAEIPPSLHCESPNPAIDFAGSPFYVNASLRPWPSGPFPRRAGVSSFGMGGTNAHVVLEEAPLPRPASPPSRAVQLLPLSARSAAALEAATEQLARHLEENPEQDLADVAYTLWAGRRAFSWRRAFLCRDAGEAVLALRDPDRLATGHAAAQPRVCFLFPGQGSQSLRMAAELYAQEPGFRAPFDSYAERFAGRLDVDLRNLLGVGSATAATAASLTRTDMAQASLFTIEVALAELLAGWGVRPEAMIGHSVGEYAAACVAGVLEPAAAVELVAARGRLMAALPPGGMLAVELSEEEVVPLLEEELDLAAVNGPRQCTVSGPEPAIEVLRERLRGRGIRGHRLATAHAFHSRAVDPLLDPFRRVLERISLGSPRVPYLSNVTGNWITDAEATSPEYWVRHLRQTVRFGAGLGRLLASPRSLLIEVGPGRVLGGLARQHPAVGEAEVLSTLPDPASTEPASRHLLGTAGRLWMAGVELDGTAFYRAERRLRLPLPTYPFERRRYWVDPPEAAPRPQEGTAGAVAPASDAPVGNLYVRPSNGSAYVAPRTETEHRLAAIWSEVLAVEQVGAEDNFFDIGGHSLLAIQLVGRVRDLFGCDLVLGDLSTMPTIAALARWIEERKAEAEARALDEVLAMLNDLSDEQAEAELRRRLAAAED